MPNRRANLPAAALSEGDPGADAVARLVPAGAQELRIGRCVLGYRASPSRARSKRSIGLAALRLFEIGTLIASRHGGGGVDTDDYELYIEIVVHAALAAAQASVASRGPDHERATAIASARTLLPVAPEVEIESGVDDAVASPRRWKADALAAELHVTIAERVRLGLRTIGACDATKRQRQAIMARRRKERDRERQAEARKAEGRIDRAAFIASSDAELARKLGVHRNTIANLRRRGTLEAKIAEHEAALCTSVAHKDNSIGDTPAQAGSRRERSRGFMPRAQVTAFADRDLVEPLEAAPPSRSAPARLAHPARYWASVSPIIFDLRARPVHRLLALAARPAPDPAARALAALLAIHPTLSATHEAPAA